MVFEERDVVKWVFSIPVNKESDCGLRPIGCHFKYDCGEPGMKSVDLGCNFLLGSILNKKNISW